MDECWKKLKYWETGEWQVIEERLDDMDYAGRMYNPIRSNLFNPLLHPVDDVRVAIIGQDPYPHPKFCTGYAFSLPKELTAESFPPTLTTIFREYCKDLHYLYPTSGDLTKWVKEGVFLWNAIPTCEAFKSLSHMYWTEWQLLTKEIVETLSKKAIVFVFLGAKAREYAKFVSWESKVIELAHPSPRGDMHSKTPFTGSRVFSTINAYLRELNKEPINWRL